MDPSVVYEDGGLLIAAMKDEHTSTWSLATWIACIPHCAHDWSAAAADECFAVVVP
jgi:hypothetical protein